MTRAADLTKKSLLESAAAAFAECGYARASIREITSRARANQAAVTYHFGGKEALYREVLRGALLVLQDAMSDEEALPSKEDRGEVLKRFMRRQLAPLLTRDRLAQPLRIFGWEAVSPSPVYLEFLSQQTIPTVRRAEAIVRLYASSGVSPEEIAIATIWLLQQSSAFIRHAEVLARPPMSLKIDRAYVDRLADQLGRMADAGLASLCV
ncbi:MAG TPA: CerR family C-terminal domain-containing protein [Beijerinckiaceae bacterium]|nr:CerR family C-terminal domain-containing protein [Beijerinckiaceae bacterium]